MAVEAVPYRRSRSLARSLARVRELSDGAVVAIVVGAASTARFLVAIPHSTPRYFPDEYLYAALARSLTHGSLSIRGEPAHFPALLESIVTAPLWLAGGVDTPFRLVQVLHALLAGLAAVPIYAVVARLGLPRWQRLACTALTPLLPVFLFAAYLTADVLGAFLALAAFAAGVGALLRPTRRAEAGFLALAALATLARFQYVVLAPAFGVAAIALAGWHPVRAARRFPILAAATGCAGAVVLALGPGHLLGYYDGLLAFDLSPLSMGKWAATDLMLLVYATGIALGPAAAVGFVTTLARPRSEAERAFAFLTAATLATILVEAVLYATNGSARFQERYLMVLLPLLAPYACLGMRRAAARGARHAIVGLSIVLFVATTRISLTDYTLEGNGQDSPTLQAVTWLIVHTSNGTAGLLVSLLAASTLVVAAIAALAPGRGTVVVVGLAAAVLAGTAAASIADDIRGTKASLALDLGSDPRWVDQRQTGAVSVLVPRDSVRWIISQQLFWNRSLTRVLTLPGAPDADAFQNDDVRVDDRGVLRRGSLPVTGPLLIEGYGAAAQLEDATLVARHGTASLYRPDGPARFVSLTDGRYFDGWLGWPFARVTVWPGSDGSRTGTLCLRFSLPKLVGASTTLNLWGPGYKRSVTVAAGGTEIVAIPRTVTGRWQLNVMAKRPFRIGPRLLSARVAEPTFFAGKASAAACR